MFGSKWYVQQHVAKMHDNDQSGTGMQGTSRQPSFKCSDCDYEFASMKERNAHVLKDHGKKFSGKIRKHRFPGQPIIVPQTNEHLLLQNQDLLQ